MSINRDVAVETVDDLEVLQAGRVEGGEAMRELALKLIDKSREAFRDQWSFDLVRSAIAGMPNFTMAEFYDAVKSSEGSKH